MGIIGHSKILNLLEKSMKKGKVSHAYLFSGPTGVGKFTVAVDFAQKLTNRNISEISSDLIVLKPDIESKRGVLKKRSIKVEKIRELQRSLALSGSGRGYKVAIIDDADMLNTASQSAFLKTLEEPSDKVVIILVVQNEKKILSTIFSRCQKIRFGLVNEKELKASMRENQKNKDEILFWSLGRPGFMLELIQDQKELNLRISSISELSKLPSKSVADKFSLAEKLSKDIDLTEKILNMWSVAIRESILKGKNSITINGDKALKFLTEIEKCLSLIKNTNSSPKLLLENLFLIF